MPASPSREPSPHRSGPPTEGGGRSSPTHRQDTIRAKLERLRSARLIRRDPKATKLDMQRPQN
jgi:hypothetical protein